MVRKLVDDVVNTEGTRPTFQFPVVDEQRIVRLPRRIPRHLAMTGTAVRALLLDHVVAAVRCMLYRQYRMDASLKPPMKHRKDIAK